MDTPSVSPTDSPSGNPSEAPTDTPTKTPTEGPSDTTPDTPTLTPTEGPTVSPSDTPTIFPTDTAECDDPTVCCIWPCSKLGYNTDNSVLAQLANCGVGCTDGVSPDVFGVQHAALFLYDDGSYYVDGDFYLADNPSGPLYFSGGVNMYENCYEACFVEPSPGDPSSAPTETAPTSCEVFCFPEK